MIMNGNEYQKLAMRINDGKAKERLDDELYYGVKISTPELLNGVLGLTGEAGEVADLVKKGIFHEKGIDKGHLKKELGDVMWYVAMICDSCGFELNDMMEKKKKNAAQRDEFFEKRKQMMIDSASQKQDKELRDKLSNRIKDQQNQRKKK